MITDDIKFDYIKMLGVKCLKLIHANISLVLQSFLKVFFVDYKILKINKRERSMKLTINTTYLLTCKKKFDIFFVFV